MGLIRAVALTLFATPAAACETALLLTVDVSNSVDEAEYRLQIDGMADALSDGEIVDALVQGRVAIAVMQWSGESRQELSIPWTRIAGVADTQALSAAARAIPRAFVMSDTAPGDAILAALDLFGPVADCGRRVLDVSGDGTPNAGRDVRHGRIAAERAGVTINAIAIESLGRTITNFYERAVITRYGFVMTARGHRDYPEAIRRKILRELSRVLG